MLLTPLTLELVLAPGVLNSAASLSYPYTNELVNSFVKTCVYGWAGGEDPHSFPVPRTAGGLDGHRDFRKWLFTYTNFVPTGHVFDSRLWGCGSQAKVFRGVRIDFISYNKFPGSAIVEFKSVNIFILCTTAIPR